MKRYLCLSLLCLLCQSVQSQVPMDGLICYYPLDGNANDLGGAGYNGVISGALPTTDRFGRPNAAYLFTTNSDRITMPAASIGMTSAIQRTITLWIKATTIPLGPNNGGMISQYYHSNTASSNFFIGIDQAGGVSRINVAGNGEGRLDSPLGFDPAGKWIHVAVVLKAGTDNTLVYVNGSLVTTGIVAYNTVLSTRSVVVGDIDGGYNTDNFRGAIDEILVYGRALSGTEIAKVYASGSNPHAILVDSPHGSEEWTVGTTQTIRWMSLGVNTVRIRYTTDNGNSWMSISSAVPASSRSISWTVRNTPSQFCRVLVSDTENPSCADQSDEVFGIVCEDALRCRIIPDEGTSVTQMRFVFKNGGTATKAVIADSVAWRLSDFKDCVWLDRIELLNGSSLIGHIGIDEVKIKGIQTLFHAVDDVVLYVHPYATNRDKADYRGWSYYRDGEKMVSMLIPPEGKFSSARYDTSPVLMVHGVSGRYPYWGLSFLDALGQSYDAWQLYYPYDQEIEASALILRDVLTHLLASVGPGGTSSYVAGTRANVVAHSMGGLVTRALIQSPEYEQNIRKVLMLGTPNNGSYSAYVLRNRLSSIVGFFVGKDNEAPAYLQMTPGSMFLIGLNDQEPRSLDGGTSPGTSYLVLAGTKDGVFGFEELSGQDDGVVGVSSASLLHLGVPLATIGLTHSGETDGLASSVPVAIVNGFLADSYTPDTPGFLSSVDGFWKNEGSPSQPGSSMAHPDRGVAILEIPSSNASTGMTQEIGVERAGADLALYFGDYSRSHSFLQSGWFSGYFSYMFNGVSDKGVGWGYEPEVYGLQFYKRVFDLEGPRWVKVGEQKTDGLNFKHLQTKKVTAKLSSAQLIALKASSQIGAGLQSLGSAESTLKHLFLPKLRSTRKQMASVAYQVDATIDSVVFALAGFESSPFFSQHSFHLLSPSGAMIDSLIAQADPQVDFEQSIKDGYAMFLVRYPEVGIWTVSFSDNLEGGIIEASVASTFDVRLMVPDSLFAVGSLIPLELRLPESQDYFNPQADAALYRSISEDTLELVLTIPLSYEADGLRFVGQCAPPTAGQYWIEVNFSCQRIDDQVARHFMTPVSIQAIGVPSLVGPVDESQINIATATLRWNRVTDAQGYSLRVFTAAVSNAVAEVSGIVDTSHAFAIPAGATDYLWQVRAYREGDTSGWSGSWHFNNPPPSAPQGVIAACGDGSVKLVWRRVHEADICCYRVYADTVPSPVAVMASSVTDTTFVASGLSNGTTYFFRITAIDSLGSESLAASEIAANPSATPVVQTDVSTSPGWRIVGLPSEVTDHRCGAIFPNAEQGTLFSFDGAYAARESLVVSRGYWVKFRSDSVVRITGTYFPTSVLPLQKGWNLIAGPSCPVPANHIVDPQGIVIPWTLYGFGESYANADTLWPGSGYWIKATAAGNVAYDCADLAVGLAKPLKVEADVSTYATLLIQDAFTRTARLYFTASCADTTTEASCGLPPIPPEGVFDVRFEGDRWLADGPSTRLLIRFADFPLTILPSNLSGPQYEHYRLARMDGEYEVEQWRLKSNTPIVLSTAGRELRLIRGRTETPEQMCLEQNYPNPFNPTTTIRYALPSAGRVSLRIYDILGQEVRTLIDAVQEAGYKSVAWNATNNGGIAVASGVYLYRFEALDRVLVKKMIVVK